MSDAPPLKSRGECVALGLGIAFVLSCFAAFAVLVSMFVDDAPPTRPGSPGAAYALFLLVVCGSYFVAGGLSGLAYHALQRHAHRYIGKVALCFIFGICAYGAVGLGSTVAYQFLGLNIFDEQSVEASWASLPWTTLALGVMSALIGPVVWFAKSGQTEIEW